MSQLTDQALALEKIAAQAHELISALEDQGPESGAADWRAIALQAAQDAYRTEMARLMAGVITCPPEALPEWLSSAQRSAERLLLARRMVGGWQVSAPLPAAQP